MDSFFFWWGKELNPGPVPVEHLLYSTLSCISIPIGKKFN